MNRIPQILVADDDRTVRTVISHALSKQGYQVGATTSVAGLWDMATTGRGDVLITDVNFPDGDALDLLPRLQAMRVRLFNKAISKGQLQTAAQILDSLGKVIGESVETVNIQAPELSIKVESK